MAPRNVSLSIKKVMIKICQGRGSGTPRLPHSILQISPRLSISPFSIIRKPFPPPPSKKKKKRRQHLRRGKHGP